MAALDYPLIVEQGSDYILEVPVLAMNGATISLSGWTAAGQIRAQFTSEVLHELDIDLIDATATVRIPASSSSVWDWPAGRYDVELTSPDELTVSRLLQGPVVIRPAITRLELQGTYPPLYTATY